MYRAGQSSDTGQELEVSSGTLHSVAGRHKLMGILHMEKGRQLHNQGNWSLQSLKMSRSNKVQGEPISRLLQNEVGIPLCSESQR